VAECVEGVRCQYNRDGGFAWGINFYRRPGSKGTCKIILGSGGSLAAFYHEFGRFNGYLNEHDTYAKDPDGFI